MYESTKSLLKPIAELLTEGSENSFWEEGSALWLILTALRGPDDYDYKAPEILKRATTAVIRHAIGVPERNRGGAIVNPDTPEFVKIRTELGNTGWITLKYGETYSVSPHFYQHVRGAFDALGLRWYSLNELPQDK